MQEKQECGFFFFGGISLKVPKKEAGNKEKLLFCKKIVFLP